MAQQKFIEGDIAEDDSGNEIIYRGGKWLPYKQAGKAVTGGFDAAAASARYNDKLAEWRAKADVARIDGAQTAEQEAYSNEATANRAAEVLAGDTPTGFAADMRMGLGKAIGGPLTSWMWGVPSKEQTANLETLAQLGNTGTLGTVGQLKGPLSDKDIAFLKTLQYNPNASKTQNNRVVDGQKWLARRQASYAAALRTWTEKLGSPSALNGKGQTFDGWWGGYSAKALPPPSLRSAGAPKRSIAASAPRKGAAYEVVAVEPD